MCWWKHNWITSYIWGWQFKPHKMATTKSYNHYWKGWTLWLFWLNWQISVHKTHLHQVTSERWDFVNTGSWINPIYLCNDEFHFSLDCPNNRSILEPSKPADLWHVTLYIKVTEIQRIYQRSGGAEYLDSNLEYFLLCN